VYAMALALALAQALAPVVGLAARAVWTLLGGYCETMATGVITF